MSVGNAQPARAGIAFQETMAGAVTMGATDPRKGVAGGSRFSLHADITVPDLQAFLDDPQHRGQLTGAVDCEPLGGLRPGRNGVFRLFAPSGRPGLSWMVYELGFEHSGRDFYLAGRKEIRRGGTVLDVWKQTTTLYVTLHAGANRKAPVAGAGVLTLGVAELIGLARTLHAIRVSGAAEKAAAVNAFGRFFLRELWDNYGYHCRERAGGGET